MIYNYSKKSVKNQTYEDYWKLTLEYSDINGSKFNTTLRIIVNFIDKHPSIKKGYNKKYYSELVDTLYKVYPKKDKGSTRKSINQFVKLGFIFPGLTGYPDETMQFIKATSNNKRELIFSKIYYNYSSFNSSVTRDNRNTKQVNFLIKTLMYHPKQKLFKDEIIGLMATDICLYPKGYLTKTELDSVVAFSEAINFESRKYNQINYFMNYLKFIPGINITNDKSLIYYTEDDSLVFNDTFKLTRDQTMFRIMKEQIKQESMDIYGDIVCYLTKKPQKGIVVSHIVPLQECLNEKDIKSAYDHNNAILLEPNIDAYFDKHNISFNNQGTPLFCNRSVYSDFINDHKNLSLDSIILNTSRLKYLSRHRETFFEKNK